jgi:hypothetical protein
MLAGDKRTASQNNSNHGDNNKGSKFQKINPQDNNPDQASNNQQTPMIDTGTMQKKTLDDA